MGNPLLERIAKASGSAHGGKSEKRLTKKLGAQGTPASGALTGAKSDAVLEKQRLEMKATIALSLSVQLEWLAKISKEALDAGQTPVVVISFVTPEGKPRMSTNAEWAMVPLWKWKDMIEDAS